ncbi:MAG: DNA methyltransferase [Algoriphagus sp. 32-45-6]|nr:MAG: DNA methyltransferase [Algoriphagus sp. 32-45-6]
MPNENLTAAKKAKNDEFYTQYHDIEKEINAYLDYNPDVFRDKTILLPCDDPEWSNFTKFFAQNFQRFGLKKLISTSYAVDSKLYKGGYQVTMFEESAAHYDAKKTKSHGKIFTLDHDSSGDGKIDVNDLEWNYLDGDGDFKSPEVKKLRNEADIIITNPPFSLFRDFLAWIMEAGKQFVIIGNMNAITYKEVFPLIKENKMWLGNGFHAGNAFFSTPFAEEYGEGVYNPETGLVKFRNVCWFTNLDHGRRHQPLKLMSLADNKRFNKKIQSNSGSYLKYDNYDAIEVPFTEAIPSDFDGIMGVPISFLDKYNPDQFEIIWAATGNVRSGTPKEIIEKLKYLPDPSDKGGCTMINGKRTYHRILVKHKNPHS